jgi:hypothetical protein
MPYLDIAKGLVAMVGPISAADAGKGFWHDHTRAQASDVVSFEGVN